MHTLPASRNSQEPLTEEFQNTFVPPPIHHIEDTGLSSLWLQDLILKILYYQGYLSGFRIAEELTLPFGGVVDQLLENLKREKLVEVKPVQQMGLGEGGYTYSTTGLGLERAQEAITRCQYVGPAPVPLRIITKRFYLRAAPERWSEIRIYAKHFPIWSFLTKFMNALVPLSILAPLFSFMDLLAMARQASHVRLAVSILTRACIIPYALYIEGQVVKLYDSVNHQILPEEVNHLTGTGMLKESLRRDLRWVHIQRPFIVVGGELTLAGLDLVFDDTNKFYEAPFQVKANGGMLLIDDFGRQLVRPRDLLNRWIVPLENRIDYLTMHTGRKVEIPFDVLVVFSTNLPPKDLVDEAFLRRLRHKIEIGNPNYDEYREIFQEGSCQKGYQL